MKEKMLNSEYGLDPQGRLRFYGIYSARVIDVKDPLKKGRIRVQVPQTTGVEVSGWANQVVGSVANFSYPYGTFARNTNQSVTAANTATTIIFDTVEDTGGGISLGTDKSRIYVKETGDYFIQFSAVFSKSSSNSNYAELWVLKNGTAVPRSNTRIMVSGNPGDQVMTVGFIADLDSGDYLQFAMMSPDHAMKLTAYTGLTSPSRPDIPAIITTINLVGNFKPRVGSNVWVMFTAGDPEYPVWIGAHA